MFDPRTDVFDARKYLLDELERNFRESVANRNFLWDNYWEGRRMVMVPENRTDGVTITGNTCTNTGGRLFPSFPNLAPKDEPIVMTTDRIAERVIIDRVDVYQKVIRDCIARLKSARAKESTNRNLSTLLAVVVKVQKDLETLVGDDWKHQDAAVESQVTRDDRSL